MCFRQTTTNLPYTIISIISSRDKQWLAPTSSATPPNKTIPPSGPYSSNATHTDSPHSGVYKSTRSWIQTLRNCSEAEKGHNAPSSSRSCPPQASRVRAPTGNMLGTPSQRNMPSNNRGQAGVAPAPHNRRPTNTTECARDQAGAAQRCRCWKPNGSFPPRKGNKTEPLPHRNMWGVREGGGGGGTVTGQGTRHLDTT